MKQLVFDFLEQEISKDTTTKTNNYYQLHNRRYIGNKQKLLDWIFSIIKENIKDNCQEIKTFTDLFAGTGVVSNMAVNKYEKIIINDFLYFLSSSCTSTSKSTTCTKSTTHSRSSAGGFYGGNICSIY